MVLYLSRHGILREHSSQKICLRLLKDMWNLSNSMCGSRFLEGFSKLEELKLRLTQPSLAGTGAELAFSLYFIQKNVLCQEVSYTIIRYSL